MARKTQTPAEYVAEHFQNAPTEWIAGEIQRHVEVLADTSAEARAWAAGAGHVEWSVGLIAAYAAILGERKIAEAAA